MANSILKLPIGLLRPTRVVAIWVELLSREASDKGNDRQSDTESTCSVPFHNNARSSRCLPVYTLPMTCSPSDS
jgi:hypothetical protein